MKVSVLACFIIYGVLFLNVWANIEDFIIKDEYDLIQLTQASEQSDQSPDFEYGCGEADDIADAMNILNSDLAAMIGSCDDLEEDSVSDVISELSPYGTANLDQVRKVLRSIICQPNFIEQYVNHYMGNEDSTEEYSDSCQSSSPVQQLFYRTQPEQQIC